MRLPLIINGFDFDLATAWPEVKTREFFAIRASTKNDLISRLSSITGVSEAMWETVDANSVSVLFTPDKDGWYPLQYLENKLDFEALPIPKELTIDGKPYPVPNPLDITLGQKTYMEELVIEYFKKHDGDITDAGPDVLACMFYPLVSGKKFTRDDAKAFKDTILDKTFIIEAYPIAAFFLLKLLGLENEMSKSFLTNLLRKKALRALTSLTSSDHSERLMPLQVGTYSREKKSLMSRTKLYLQSFGWRKRKLNSKSV